MGGFACLLGPVVDELAVDEAVNAMGLDLLNLGLHLVLFGPLNLGQSCCGLDGDTGSKNLDLVSVHGSVGNQNLGILHPLGLVGSDPLRQDESWPDTEWVNKVGLEQKN